MTELVLVRHGEPDWEPAGRAVDHPALTPRGRQQADRLADRLGCERFDAIYTSPLRRARETAVPIERALGMPAREESWLRELGLPSLQGQTSEQVQAFFAAASRRELDRWWDGYPGGESFRHFYDRVSAGIEGLLASSLHVRCQVDAGQRIWQLPDDEGSRLLLVAHEGTTAIIVSHLLGLEPVPWAWKRFSLSWAAIARLRCVRVAAGSVWALAGFNDRAHLEGVPDRAAADAENRCETNELGLSGEPSSAIDPGSPHAPSAPGSRVR